ncbi:centriolar and ciliogenesis-associated protein HYLS1 [Chironomus tepperi]|uniref:centriolar and ciliogenesis-associated protein HYLS1 n=1 Tax=Chironomus tepperi TaxID=113505 RepID=UPI00391F764B
MDLTVSLDAREVLFHLNYMGYRNVTKEQLKSFMIDLKKLIRYDSQPQKSTTEIQFQAGPHSVNIQRLFESHTETSKLKQREKHLTDNNKQTTAEKAKDHKHHVCKHKQLLTREKTSSDIEKKSTKFKDIPKKVSESNSHDKENIPKHDNNQEKDQNNRPTTEKDPSKSKMWIRPKSAQSTRQNNPKKRNDPVALYQEYQKDWQKFRSNICESSRSELRWSIREKMLANH